MHTPGPWTHFPILSGSENDKGFCVTGVDRVWVADVSPMISNERGDASKEAEANARLISAAPDLLAVLRAMTGAGGGMSITPELQVQAKNAIAKAEGK